MKCTNCGETITLTPNGECPNCLIVLSVPDDTMDQLVQQASLPNLATLFKQGKEKGYIPKQQEYTNAG